MSTSRATLTSYLNVHAYEHDNAEVGVEGVGHEERSEDHPPREDLISLTVKIMLVKSALNLQGQQDSEDQEAHQVREELEDRDAKPPKDFFEREEHL